MFDKDVIMLQVGFYRCFFFSPLAEQKKTFQFFFFLTRSFVSARGSLLFRVMTF